MEHKILNRYPIGNPRRKWTQDNFVLSQFKAYGNNMRRHIKACADVGFDTVELGWASDEQADAAVQLCEQFINKACRKTCRQTLQQNDKDCSAEMDGQKRSGIARDQNRYTENKAQPCACHRTKDRRTDDDRNQNKGCGKRTETDKLSKKLKNNDDRRQQGQIYQTASLI